MASRCQPYGAGRFEAAGRLLRRGSPDWEAFLTWERFRHFHREPRVIATWLKLFGPGLRWLTPVRRRLLLGLASLFVAARLPWKNLTQAKHWPDPAPPDRAGLVVLTLALFGFVAFCYVASRRFASLPAWVKRHPQTCLHAVFWVLLGVWWTTSPANPMLRTLMVGCAFVMPFLLWRVGYMILAAQRGKMAGSRFTDHLLYLYPTWGTGSNTPYGKGWDYLSANEARDETALAKSQLAGIKLLLLGALWAVASDLLKGVVLGKDNAYRHALGGISPPLPTVGALLDAPPGIYSIGQGWAALYVDLFQRVLGLASKGHLVIGWVRIFGFNVFRNTYKPLLAETVVDFWNRYYHYFKELLVNFFFYPAFTRYFKPHPRLRMFAAVFMAAFVGNMYYHWLSLESALVSGSVRGMWAALQSRLFYCALLTIGIYLSMRREQKKGGKRPNRPGWRRVPAIFGVWTFFSIIHIWALKDQTPFVERLQFFLGLVGLG